MVCVVPAIKVNVHSAKSAFITGHLVRSVIFKHTDVVQFSPQGSVRLRPYAVTPLFRFSEHQQDTFWVRKRLRMETRILQIPSIFMKEIGKCKQKLFRQK